MSINKYRNIDIAKEIQTLKRHKDDLVFEYMFRCLVNKPYKRVLNNLIRVRGQIKAKKRF